jgi:multidrug efflux pump subunit AcrA (membrane-fusion protein)
MVTLENSKNQVEASEQSVKSAKTNLDYSIIYAPFDGTIGFSQVKLGELVVVGQTVLNTISTNDPLAVDFLINEKQLPNFEKIQAKKEKPIDSLFTILLPNNSLYNETGKISVIDRAVDPQTGSIRVRLEFPNPDHFLKAGMSCIVRVHNQDSAPQIVIPNRAIVEQMGEYFVFIVKDTIINNTSDSSKNSDTAKKSNSDTSANKGPRLMAFQIKVLLGQTIGPNVIVKKGLRRGDKVVTDGVQLLHDGSTVSLGMKHPPNKDSAGNNSPNNNNQNLDSSKNQ